MPLDRTLKLENLFSPDRVDLPWLNHYDLTISIRLFFDECPELWYLTTVCSLAVDPTYQHRGFDR